jgi:TPR repeat protein
MYSNGYGVDIDDKKAIELFLKAAKMSSGKFTN